MHLEHNISFSSSSLTFIPFIIFSVFYDIRQKIDHKYVIICYYIYGLQNVFQINQNIEIDANNSIIL